METIIKFSCLIYKWISSPRGPHSDKNIIDKKNIYTNIHFTWLFFINFTFEMYLECNIIFLIFKFEYIHNLKVFYISHANTLGLNNSISSIWFRIYSLYLNMVYDKVLQISKTITLF